MLKMLLYRTKLSELSPNTECCSLACLEMIDEDNLRDQRKIVDVGVKLCRRR